MQARETTAYLVDDGLMQKFNRSFEPPSEDEIDVRIDLNLSRERVVYHGLEADALFYARSAYPMVYLKAVFDTILFLQKTGSN